MRDWQLAYLGRRAFPAEVTEFELRQAFTFELVEQQEIRRAFRSRLRIAAALQLGFLRLTGATLRTIEHVPTSVLHHLARQFAVQGPDLATLRSLYRRKKTRRAHRRWAIEYEGFRTLDTQGESTLTTYIRERTHATMTRTRLEQSAREWLYRQRYLIPRERRLSRLARAVISHVVDEDRAALVQALGAQSLQSCLSRLLERRRDSTMTHLEWLRCAPGRRSLKTMRALYEKYVWLEGVLAKRRDLPIPKERQRVYARRFRRRRSADICSLPLARQELEAACFATVTLATLADDLLRLVEIRIAAIWTWAHRIAAAEVTPARVHSRGQILAELRRLVADTSLDDATYRSHSAALLVPATGTTLSSRAADVREVLTRNARRVRPMLELLLKLDLQGDPQHLVRRSLEWIRFYYKDKIDWVFGHPPIDWTGRWRALIDGRDLPRGLRAYEAATLYGVRRALRNGSLWSPYGDEFSDPARNRMPAPIWQQRAPSYRLRKDLPSCPQMYTDKVQAALRAALAGLEGAVSDKSVWIGRRDVFFRRDEAEREPDGLDLAQVRLYRQVGRVQFPTVLLELDARVHFSWQLLGREPKDAQELLAVYAALLAAGTDLASRGIATMIRGVRESTVRRYMRLFEAEPALRAANEALVKFARAHPIVEHWGSGYAASSDLMSLDASKHLYTARVDPKRRVHGVGIYQTVLDQWGIPYDQPLPLLQRQAGAAIEGVLRQRVSPIRQLAVDTHGFTFVAHGLSKLLGFDLCPREHDMRDQWLHVPRDWPEMPALEQALRRDVDLELLHAEYDNLLHLAASIEDGYTSATYALERLGAAARGTRTHAALTHLGQLWHTVYLCDYAAQPPFRRGVNRLLVRGESVHQLERAIHYGPIRADRGRRRDELVLISGALTLLTNAVIAYNTWKLQEVLDRRRAAGRSIPSDTILAHIAPVAFSHINFRGIYRFPIEQYLHRLLSSGGQRQAASA
jgi:TnpA family transposase